MRESLIKFNAVRLGYGKRVVFNSLNLAVCKGDFLGIVGPNGSGKTTLLRSMMGVLRPQQGEIERAVALRFGYCMQRQFIDTIFPFTVFEIVMMARTRIIGPMKKPGKTDKEKVLYALEIAGISRLVRERFYNLSGGQKQRVLIARALSVEPEFLILDEPTADLDIKAEREILGLIDTLHQKENLTVALVSHELNNVINYARKFIFLNPVRNNSDRSRDALDTKGEGISNGVNRKIPYRVFTRDELNEDLLSEIFETKIKLKEVNGKQIII